MAASAPQQTNPERGLTVRQKKALSIREAIEERQVDLLDVMPDGLNLKRFIRTTLIAVSRNDDLLDCTPESVVRAIFEAAECGIEPTGSLGRGYLVPIKDHGVLKAEFWIGYPGLIDLAMRSDRVSKVWSRPVFKGDKYEVHLGTRDEIVHQPGGGEPLAAELTDVYACVEYKNGVVDFEPLTKAQVDLVRARARGSNNAGSAWQTDYIEQARKTAIRKLAKRLPLTAEAASAIQRDEEREFGFEERRKAAAAAETRSASLKEDLKARAKGETTTDAPGAAAEPEVAPTAAPVVSATQQSEGVVTVAETAPPADQTTAGAAPEQAGATPGTDSAVVEQVEGEVVCEDKSPYDDGSTCVLIAKHKGFHKGADGATWGRTK